MTNNEVMRLCPEWEKQHGVLITWPHQYSVWRDMLDNINDCYQQIAWHISRFEPVHIICYDEKLRDSIHHRLTNIGIPEQQLHFYLIATNDTWIRDYGPLRLHHNESNRYIDFQYNAWGGKYSFDLDNSATKKLFQLAPFNQQQLDSVDFVLEGGSIDVNDNGSLLTSISCLLNSNRNQNYNKTQIESLLTEKLGINEVIWIDCDKLEGDDTDGHIDTLARFCNNNTIIYHNDADLMEYPGKKSSRLYNSLVRHNNDRSSAMTLVSCPAPNKTLRGKYDFNQGQPLPATYINFLIINDAVLVPSYQDTHDQEAQSICKHLFPEREIIAIDCVPLLQQYGSLHCATMQF